MATRLRKMTAALLLFGLMASGCRASSTIETTAPVPTATSVPSASASPTVPVQPTIVEPTATPASPPPTAAPAPSSTAVPTAAPAPTSTVPPLPTVEPSEPELFSEVMEEIREVAALPSTGPRYDEFVDVSDDSGFVFATVPAAWSDVDGRPWNVDGTRVGNSLAVSTDIDAWQNEWDQPGLFIGASAELPFTSVASFLDEFDFDQWCDYVERRDYFDGLYSGLADIWINCGPERSLFVQIVAEPEDASYLIEVQLQAPTEPDLDALITVVESFTAEPSAPAAGGFEDLLEEIRNLTVLPTGGGAYEYVEQTDDTGRIVVSAPSSWTDVYGGPYDDDDLQSTGAGLTITTDNEAWHEGLDTPGIFIGTLDQSPFGTPEELVQEFWYGDSCTYEGERPYDDGLYVGVIDLYTDCGGSGSLSLQLAAAPADRSYLILVDMVAVTARDVEALITALASFTAGPG